MAQGYSALVSFSWWWCSCAVHSCCVCNSRAERRVKAASMLPPLTLPVEVKTTRSVTAIGFQLQNAGSPNCWSPNSLVLKDAFSQCQVLSANKTSSETAQDPASPKYQKITRTTPTRAGTMQLDSIFGPWPWVHVIKMVPYEIIMLGCQMEEEWLVLLGRADRPLSFPALYACLAAHWDLWQDSDGFLTLPPEF